MANRRPLLFITIFLIYLNLYLTLERSQKLQNEECDNDVNEQADGEHCNGKPAYTNETFQFLRTIFGLGSSNLNDYYDQKNISTEDEDSQNKTWIEKDQSHIFKNIIAKNNHAKFEPVMIIDQHKLLEDKKSVQDRKIDENKYMDTTTHYESNPKPILWELRSNDSVVGVISNVIMGVYIEPNLLLSYEVKLKIDEFGLITIMYDLNNPEHKMSFLELLDIAKVSTKKN